MCKKYQKYVLDQGCQRPDDPPRNSLKTLGKVPKSRTERVLDSFRFLDRQSCQPRKAKMANKRRKVQNGPFFDRKMFFLLNLRGSIARNG